MYGHVAFPSEKRQQTLNRVDNAIDEAKTNGSATLTDSLGVEIRIVRHSDLTWDILTGAGDDEDFIEHNADPAQVREVLLSRL